MSFAVNITFSSIVAVGTRWDRRSIEPPFTTNISFSWDISEKWGKIQKIKPPEYILKVSKGANPPSKSRPLAPVLVQWFDGGVRGRFGV